MRSHSSIVTILATIIILNSCSSSLETGSKTEKGVKLKDYKTYAWVVPHEPDAETKRDDKIYAKLIQQLSDDELQKKGMVIDVEQPDAVFVFNTQVEDRVQYVQSPTVTASFGYGGPGYYMGMGAPIYGGQIESHIYQQGILTYHMYDTKTKQLLWQGWAQKPISPSSIESDIKTAVKQIFIRLPIKHKK